LEGHSERHHLNVLLLTLDDADVIVDKGTLEALDGRGVLGAALEARTREDALALITLWR